MECIHSHIARFPWPLLKKILTLNKVATRSLIKIDDLETGILGDLGESGQFTFILRLLKSWDGLSNAVHSNTGEKPKVNQHTFGVM